MLTSARICLWLLILPYLTGSVCGGIQSFKCFNNVLGRISGLERLMPPGQVTSLPDARGISAVQCASLCLERKNTCSSFAYYEGRCFVRNITLAQPGLICGVSVLEGRLRCPVGRIGDVFIAFGGANGRMMECMCGLTTNIMPPWTDMPNVARYDCVDKCTTSACFLILGSASICCLCNGNFDYCQPFGDLNPTNPQRVGCTPII